MPRTLPSVEEARQILAAKRTRPQRRAAPPAGRALDALLKRLDERYGQGADGLKARWREIVGEAVAQRTEPMKLVKGRAGASLELKVDGPAAALIQHQAGDILARVNAFLGPEAVERLRIVQGVVRRPAAEASAKAAQARRRRAQPLDAAVEAELEQGLARGEDPGLNAALRRLGREVLRQGR